MKKWLVACLAGLISLTAHAAIQPGTDYTPLAAPQAVANKNRVEVIEFFSYGCGHCFKLEPASEAWAKNKPADVDFRREQIVWDKRMDGLARLFAAIQASGQSGKLHHAAFIAVQQERLDLRDPKIVQDWVARQGVDAARFMQVYNSFSVAQAPARATQLTRAYRVEGTPMLVVGGKYAVTPAAPERMMQVVGELVDKVRAEQKK
ncbi:thiol:disulfide interchange protein DsbA/DsbL [Laribacter hongkongensis]|uniref:thiol:disulfide interchange protein DsbA/DsbL n=1 Tax=Laribacter hongkongensis TaxID=168471 RepID=UPI001EFC69AF|nr:thiol:disulfide interchange protein DsbA/DsbL [Laribacter hongkongensis]MCG9055667.1 thiol:disulfide interchange protein DsbA/DsbL [Laribacter hongkongensis]